MPVRRDGELEDKPPHFRQHRVGRGCSNEKYDYRQLTDHQWGEVKAGYYGMISLVDHNIGRVLQALRDKGIEDNIRLYFGSDWGLHIESTPGHGTRVTLRVPALEDVQPDGKETPC